MVDLTNRFTVVVFRTGSVAVGGGCLVVVISGCSLVVEINGCFSVVVAGSSVVVFAVVVVFTRSASVLVCGFSVVDLDCSVVVPCFKVVGC